MFEVQVGPTRVDWSTKGKASRCLHSTAWTIRRWRFIAGWHRDLRWEVGFFCQPASTQGMALSWSTGFFNTSQRFPKREANVDCFLESWMYRPSRIASKRPVHERGVLLRDLATTSKTHTKEPTSHPSTWQCKASHCEIDKEAVVGRAQMGRSWASALQPRPGSERLSSFPFDGALVARYKVHNLWRNGKFSRKFLRAKA